MNGYKEAKVSIYFIITIVIVSLLFYFVASMFTSMGYSGMREAQNANISEIDVEKPIFIIDPGHGGEDPGATVDQILEKDLNLEMSLVLGDMLNSFGYKSVFTRTEDILLYHSGEEQKKKYYDLFNRVKFAEKYENSVFVSVHMNKFPASYCKGLQTFYSENNELSIKYADAVQNSVLLLQYDNKRTIKPGNDTIYLLNKLEMPAILIECGFISNPDEAKDLSDAEYQQALALCIYCGLAEILEESIDEK